MAGHLPIKITDDLRLKEKIEAVIKIVDFDIIRYFRHLRVAGVTIQALPVEEYKMDDKDHRIFSIINWDFKSEELEFEGCNIEVHLDKNKSINQIYFVA